MRHYFIILVCEVCVHVQLASAFESLVSNHSCVIILECHQLALFYLKNQRTHFPWSPNSVVSYVSLYGPLAIVLGLSSDCQVTAFRKSKHLTQKEVG